jgi:hypothetical protein
MDEERLIVSVQQHPCLYDLQHPQYDNNLYKENVWKEISKILQTSIDDCKTRWTNLRAYYRRALQRRKTTSGQASKKVRKWRFEEQMQFLKNHMQERDTVSNLTFNEEGEEEEDVLTVETEEADFDKSTPLSSPATSLSPAPGVVAAKSLPSKKKKNAPTASLADALSTFIESRNRPTDKQPKEDTVEGAKKKSLMIFFESIAESMIKFTELDCAEVKHEIFNIVNAKEIEILKRTQHATPAFYPGAAGPSYDYPGYPGYPGYSVYSRNYGADGSINK